MSDAAGMEQPSAEQLDRFYDFLHELRFGLDGARALSDCHGRMSWPHRGVYFFFEPGERRSRDDSASRVVRVGTHAVSRGSGSTLWQRLRAHRGTRAGTGNHRGSIFRLHVGAAILERNPELACETWADGSSAPAEVRKGEAFLERRVSKRIGEMPLLWLAVDGEPGPASDRAYIERNSIALLSGLGRSLDPPSEGWLGHACPAEKVRRSGLWNVNHVAGAFDPRALDVLETYVDVTLGRRPPPDRRLAPEGWYDEGRS